MRFVWQGWNLYSSLSGITALAGQTPLLCLSKKALHDLWVQRTLPAASTARCGSWFRMNFPKHTEQRTGFWIGVTFTARTSTTGD